MRSCRPYNEFFEFPSGLRLVKSLGRVKIVAWLAFVVSLSVPLLAEQGAVAIADFGTSIQTDQNSFFRCFGGQPDQIADQLKVLGSPKAGAWHIRLFDDAPTSKIGVLIPLFDERGTTRRAPIRIDSEQQFAIRILGELGDRQLHIEIVPTRNPENAGRKIGAVRSSQLDTRQWCNIQFPFGAASLDGTPVGFIRIVANGGGAAWFAIDSVGLIRRTGQPIVSKRKASEAHSLRTALWVWRTDELLRDRRQVDKLLDTCSKQGITDLFCQVHYTYEGGVVRLLLADEQRQLNAVAAARGIAVHALDGAPQYALSENHDRMFLLLDALGSLNARATPEERYHAIHLDNEPYLLADWRLEAERREIIAQYIALNRKLSAQAKSLGFEYGVDIPFWWDAHDRDGVAKFVYETEAGKEPILEALFPLLDNVGIMSYRDRVTGPNGLVAHCLEEFTLGQKFGVDVFAAVELGVGEEVERGTTFGVYPWSYFHSQLATLENILSHTPGCAGLAIHHAKPFAEAMK